MVRSKLISIVDSVLSPFNLVLRRKTTWDRVVSGAQATEESAVNPQNDRPVAANPSDIPIPQTEEPILPTEVLSPVEQDRSPAFQTEVVSSPEQNPISKPQTEASSPAEQNPCPVGPPPAAPSPTEQSLRQELEVLKKTIAEDRSELATYAMRLHRDVWIRRNVIEGKELHYRPTHDGFGPYINSEQQYFTTCPMQGQCIVDEIPGWLTPEDAMKLYEMAFYCEDDILELGTFQGLSTSIMAKAVISANKGTRIYTVDLTPSCTQMAESYLRKRGVDHVVHFLRGDGAGQCRQFIEKGQRFGFVFVDHSHRYQDVYAVCQLLEHIVIERGYCLFHDFTSFMNFTPTHKYYDRYGVPHAVLDVLPAEHFDICGLFGASALYRRR